MVRSNGRYNTPNSIVHSMLRNLEIVLDEHVMRDVQGGDNLA
jgi:hypothetical protein